MLRQLPIHVGGLLVRNVHVLATVNQQRRGILRRHVAGRTEGIERSGVLGGVQSSDLLRPHSLLPAIKKKAAAAVLSRRSSQRHRTNSLPGLPTGYQRRAIQGIGLADPVAGDVAETPEGEQGPGLWLHAVAGSES